MSKVFRPDGWVNPHSNMGQRTNNHRKYDAYEDGASAMLKVIIYQIKALENPYETVTQQGIDQYAAYEHFRLDILKSLEG